VRADVGGAAGAGAAGLVRCGPGGGVQADARGDGLGPGAEGREGASAGDAARAAGQLAASQGEFGRLGWDLQCVALLVAASSNQQPPPPNHHNRCCSTS